MQSMRQVYHCRIISNDIVGYSYIDRTELHARIDNSSHRSLLTYTILSKYGRDVAPH